MSRPASTPPTPASPPPGDDAPDSPGQLVVGFLLLTACLEIGEACKESLHLVLPGSILGLFGLLALLAAGVLSVRWVAAAARWLLWLLPLLFMPIFTLTLKNRDFWLAQGRVVAVVVLFATAALLVFAGRLAQWLLESPGRDVPPPSPPSKAHPDGAATMLAVAAPFGLNLPDLALLGPIVGWSALTAGVYFACRWVFLRVRWSVLYPGWTGIIVMSGILAATGHPDASYQRETTWITWLLGPAVVAMAVPIYQLRATVRANSRVLALVIPLALVFAVVSTSGLLAAAGRPRAVAAAGSLKSITSPVGLRLAQDAHVPTDASLAGILLAGMFGATLGTPLMRLAGVRDERALGLALGCTSHGIGVARALETGRAAGAFASLGMSGTAMLGATVLPFVLHWIAGTR